MYADVGNQLIHLFRFFAAFLLLFYALPKLMFSRPEGDGFERAGALFLKMSLFVIVSGYVLVLLKIFEVLALVAVYGLVIGHRTSKRRKETNINRMKDLTVSTFDLLEGKLPLGERVRQRLREKGLDWKMRLLRRLRSVPSVWMALLLLVIFAAAAYIRMYDAVATAPPALSDGNVTLEWMKKIDDRILFASGVYPQGFHITLDTIHKFASIDWLYVLKYMGPFNMLLVMLGMYLFVSRLSGNRAAGAAAAAVFGLLGDQFGGPFDRQAATNSQEFAFVFVWPTLYFLHRFLKDRRRDDLFVAGAGMAATGMVHAVAYGYLGLGVLLVLAYHLAAQGKQAWRAIAETCAAGAVSVAASLAPVAVGLYVLRRPFHSSSADYLTAETDDVAPEIVFRELQPMDEAALAALAILGLAALLALPKFRLMAALWIPLLIGSATFAMYQWGGAVTNSLVVATRSGELWALALPVTIGIAYHAVVRPFAERRMKLQLALVSAAVAATLWLHPPQPVEPYKMTWNSNVEQYLRISNEFLPRSWTIVGKEDDYAIIFGTGYHQYWSWLLNGYDPRKPHLTKFGEEKRDKEVTENVFIYVEKQLFRVEETNSIYSLKEADYERWERETKAVEEWVRIHKEAGHPVEVYYEDEVLKIYHLRYVPTREEIMETIWGSQRGS
ncbi:hypothetical protein [Paenibacillus sp.]|uniref:hypothetical protein n=1 Tax=Paenibacillus sp. TaxID=58172 RepID=UPI002D24BED3|nr:hypothetical protein [Paenibacillus sp.]HZG58489.1 hypothetical protein [Paenibacillus sp.]